MSLAWFVLFMVCRLHISDHLLSTLAAIYASVSFTMTLGFKIQVLSLSVNSLL